MSRLKQAIFDELRKHYVDDEIVSLSDEGLNKYIFHHPDGLRLTLQGFIRLKKIFTVYSFSIPDTLKSRHHYGMSKMEYPYFLTQRRLILFSEMDAMIIKLHGGIEGFLETCSHLD